MPTIEFALLLIAATTIIGLLFLVIVRLESVLDQIALRGIVDRHYSNNRSDF
jgi:hypothetical protein